MKRTTKLIFSACLCAGAVAGLLKAYADAVLSGEPSSKFETAVEIIKKYETLHQPRHWPFVGYGHRVLPGEKFPRNRALDEATADKILRKDLLKNCAVFRNYGADSLLLGVLAYNIGMGAVSRSSLTKRLAAGDRDIRDLISATAATGANLTPGCECAAPRNSTPFSSTTYSRRQSPSHPVHPTLCPYLQDCCRS